MIYNLDLELDRQEAKQKLITFIEDKKIIELSIKRFKRSNKQNKYIHVLFTLFGLEFGYTIDEAKTLIKRECSFMLYEKNGIKFIKSTAILTTEEMTKFIEWFRNYSQITCGLYLPSPDEYNTDRARYEREISRAKEFM
jgi:hypothetical protein